MQGQCKLEGLRPRLFSDSLDWGAVCNPSGSIRLLVVDLQELLRLALLPLSPVREQLALLGQIRLLQQVEALAAVIMEFLGLASKRLSRTHP